MPTCLSASCDGHFNPCLLVLVKSKSPAKASEGGGGSPENKMAASGLTEGQLQLSVEVRNLGVGVIQPLGGGWPQDVVGRS